MFFLHRRFSQKPSLLLFASIAYATVDHKEFFAEMSVAYLCNGYTSLDTANHSFMEDCSPPLLHPTATERVLKQHGIEDEPLEEPENPCWFLWHPKMSAKPKLRLVNPILQEYALGRSCLDVAPCNKTYPFTKGQLKHFDSELYHAMNELWKEIAMWDDPEDDRTICQSLKSVLPSWLR